MEDLSVDENDKPQPPAPAECCESGCETCVWDVYFEELRQWKEAQADQDDDK